MTLPGLLNIIYRARRLVVAAAAAGLVAVLGILGVSLAVWALWRTRGSA